MGDLGLCLAAFADLPLPSALSVAVDLSVNVVDLPLDSVFAVRPDSSLLGTGLPTLARELGRLDLRVACVSNSRDCQLLLGPHGPHTDGVCAGDADSKRAHGERHAYEAIEVASALGAPLVRLFFGCPDYARWLTWSGSDVSWNDNIRAFAEVAAPIAKAAEAAGVMLCIEPHVKQVPYSVVATQACLEAVQELGGSMGICLDVANLAATGYDPVDVIHSLDVVPMCAHAKDLERWPRSTAPPGKGWVGYGPHPPIRFRSVPRGLLDWSSILTALADHHFSGPLLVEHEDLLVDRVKGVTEALNHLRPLLPRSSTTDRWW